MRKKILGMSVGIILMIASNTYAGQQTIIPSESPIYERLYDLSVLEGRVPFSDSIPMSVVELQRILDVYALAGIEKENMGLYESIKRQLIIKDYGIEVSPELYMHSSESATFSQDESWYHNYHSRLPIAAIYGGFSFEDKIYGYAKMAANNSQFHVDTGDSSGFFSPHVKTNLILDDSYDNFDSSTPWRAYISLGDYYWNFQVGRDLIRWGNGQTGNLIIDDHMDYHEYARLTAFNDHLKFTMLVLSFDHPSSYQESVSLSDPIEGYELFVAHRLEAQIGQRMRLAVSESIMYQGLTVDPGILNPLMFLHNLYIKGNSNSLAEISLSYTPYKGVNLYSQLAIDQLRVVGEGASEPSAFGGLAGVNYVKRIHEGLLMNLGFEVVYTDPYLYLRDGSTDGYPIDFIVGYRKSSPNTIIPVDLDFLGYERGSDNVVVSFRAGLSDSDRLDMDLTLSYLLHGCIDQNSTWGEGEAYASLVAPSTQDPADSRKDSIERLLSSSYSVDYAITTYTSVHAHLDWVHCWNYQNLSNNGYESDIQLSTGITIRI